MTLLNMVLLSATIPDIAGVSHVLRLVPRLTATPTHTHEPRNIPTKEVLRRRSLLPGPLVCSSFCGLVTDFGCEVQVGVLTIVGSGRGPMDRIGFWCSSC